MRKPGIIAGVLSVVVVTGTVLFQRYALYVPGLLGDLRNPIGPTQSVA